MLDFETEKSMPHAAYGYLFLKSTSSLGESAEAILYHHTPYSAMGKIKSNYLDYAQIITIADNLDLRLRSGYPDAVSNMARFSGTKFSPFWYGELIKADNKMSFAAEMSSGDFDKKLESLTGLMGIDPECAEEYLRMLVYAIDFKSNATVTHTTDNRAVACTLAGLFGLNDSILDDIAAGAFLHDLGKIAIPPEILEKPGKLTAPEMEIMKTHVAISEEIISGYVSDRICNIACRHHEKLNGKGYHKGLSAPDLTLPERIEAVADVFSALLGRRSYKDVFPDDEIKRILSAMKDRGELCPEVIDMSLAHFAEIKTAVQKSRLPVETLYRNMHTDYENITKAAPQ